MRTHPARMYLWISLALLASYMWLGYQFLFNPRNQSTFSVCLIRNVTGIPCPSCGTTRSMNALLQGRISEAFETNPLGLSMMPLLLILPVWMAYDLFRKRETLYSFYLSAVQRIKHKQVAIPLILIWLANWVWNIMKQL